MGIVNIKQLKKRTEGEKNYSLQIKEFSSYNVIAFTTSLCYRNIAHV